MNDAGVRVPPRQALQGGRCPPGATGRALPCCNKEYHVPKDNAGWTGFLLAAFGAVGLVGAAGIYGAQVPFEHAMARDAVLTQALADSTRPDAAARLDALRPALDDSADHILSGPGDFAARVAAERARMFAAFAQEAHNIRVRMLIGLAAFTAGGALFGALVLSIVGRS
jgi:hypothetical protein